MAWKDWLKKHYAQSIKGIAKYAYTGNVNMQAPSANKNAL